MLSSTTEFDLDRTRDLKGRGHQPWVRRVGLLLMGVIVVLALLGRFGQTEQSHAAASPSAKLEVLIPGTLRGGLLWRARIIVHARQKIAAPVLVLGPGYVRGMQLNTIEPSPTSETSRAAGLAFSYPTLEAGQSLTVYLQLQVDPTVIGAQDLSVGLEGANIDPVRVPASTRVLP
jgi:hypothetical protein